MLIQIIPKPHLSVFNTLLLKLTKIDKKTPPSPPSPPNALQFIKPKQGHTHLEGQNGTLPNLWWTPAQGLIV